MSLDIAIIDEAGQPKASVPLTSNEQWTLLQEARRLALPLWTRMSDYYQDADYRSDEVSALADETSQLRHSCQDADLLAKLEEIENMLRVAANEQSPVSAIAD